MNSGNVSVKELLFIMTMFLPMVLVGIFGMWPLFFVFLIFNISFGVLEFLYAKNTGKTVSQHFWAYSKAHKIKAILILVSMLAMWIALIYHLGMKMFTS